jgi:hypothetical protein
MYAVEGCQFCGGYPLHRITCPMLRWLVLLGFIAAIVAPVVAGVLSALGAPGFSGVNPFSTGAVVLVAATGMLVYEIRYRAQRNR